MHAVSGAIVSARGNITESQQFSSADTGRFFIRLQVESLADRAEFEAALAPVIERYGMAAHIDTVGRPLRTLVLASTAAHCVNDLLFRQRAGQLPVHIPLVLSQPLHAARPRRLLRRAVRVASGDGCREQGRLRGSACCAAVDEHDIELVVLARYMQILTPELCERLEGMAINIHHSFLPGFKGANPYKQAHARGVKLIGATAHFVTSDLDEGPIIEQNVVRVDHSRSPASSSPSARTRRAAPSARPSSGSPSAACCATAPARSSSAERADLAAAEARRAAPIRPGKLDE